tara:strand:+ start:49 stop:639 length:591 start_codon:yes stop_codon:yes gene_type:complete
MSKNKKNNPYLDAYNKADKNLTQLMSEIKMLTTNPRNRMNEDTYTYKVKQLTFKYANLLGHIGPGGQPTKDLNFMVQDLEKAKASNANALGSRYQKRDVTSLAEQLLIGGGFTGATGSGMIYPNTRVNKLPQFTNKSSGSDYKLNPYYIDSFNPKGEANLEINKEKAAVDQYGRDYDNPNFGINPNRLNLSIQDGE